MATSLFFIQNESPLVMGDAIRRKERTMKQRVCAYARVSSNSSSQEHSFNFQSDYWNRVLSQNPDFEYVGLYADKGISGKFAERRPQFMSMVNAIKDKKIDMVFTKSVQRFARNTQELLTYVRMFRDLGVGVYFEKENINTLTNGNDLYLTIAVAVAEDDLSRYSQNVVWSIKDKFKNGRPVVNGRLYGYIMGIGEGDSFRINEDEAKVVLKIYEMRKEGISTLKIRDYLNENNIPSPNGGIWHTSSVDRIIHNEKYVGDCLMQKTYRKDGESIKNNGTKDQYFMENHHKGIVSRELWNAVQEVCKTKGNPKLKGRTISAFPFTGLIECGYCGRHYRHKINKSYYTKDYALWMCPTDKDKCPGIRIKDSELRAKFISAYNEFVSQKYKGEEEQDVQNVINELESQQLELSRLEMNGWISKEDYALEISKLNTELNEQKEKLMKHKLRNLSERDFRKITYFDESKVHRFLTKIVIRGINVDFHFYNSVVIRREIEETRIYSKTRQLLLKEN